MFENVSREQYDQALADFDILVQAATNMSQGASGRRAETGRHYYASVLYTRLCGWAVSLLTMLPGNRLSRQEFENWDFSAVATLSRNLIECYLAFFYLCIDPDDEVIWDCRWNLFNLHDCLRRRRLMEFLGENASVLSQFDDDANALRNRLRDNTYFAQLEPGVQSECLKGRKLYLQTQDELMQKVGFEADHYRAIYILLSSHVHTYPLGFYRLGEGGRGRGLENDVDRSYITGCIELCGLFLERAQKEMLELFPNAEDG